MCVVLLERPLRRIALGVLHASTYRLLFLFIEVATSRVLAWVDLFVIEELDEAVEAGGHEGTDERSDPVDPVVTHELSGSDSRSETASWVEGTAGVEDACSELARVACVAVLA